MKRIICLAQLLLCSLFPVRATVIVQWNFNSPMPDNSTATGTLLPSIGSGLASIVGIPTDSFTGGDTAAGMTPRGRPTTRLGEPPVIRDRLATINPREFVLTPAR